jgi:glycosyl transferase family 2
VNAQDIDFSLLLPTRGRVHLVQRLFESVVATCRDARRLEIVLYVDEDDHESRQIVCSSLSLVKIVGQPRETMGRMNRACYDASHGRYVILMNDDAVFRTPGWDNRVLQAANDFPDGIALIYGNDLDQGEAVPTFPILPRAVCDVLGGVCPPGYRNLHIESHLLDIFRQLARLGHDRIRYLDDVVFEHMHHAVGKASLDPTYVKNNHRADDLLFIALDDERYFKAKLLAQHIAARSKYSVETGAQRVSIGGLWSRRKAGLPERLKRIFHS